MGCKNCGARSLTPDSDRTPDLSYVWFACDLCHEPQALPPDQVPVTNLVSIFEGFTI